MSETGEFRVGDRVRAMINYIGAPIGSTGMVVKIYGRGRFPIDVAWDRDLPDLDPWPTAYDEIEKVTE